MTELKLLQDIGDLLMDRAWATKFLINQIAKTVTKETPRELDKEIITFVKARWIHTPRDIYKPPALNDVASILSISIKWYQYPTSSQRQTILAVQAENDYTYQLLGEALGSSTLYRAWVLKEYD